MNEPPFIRLVSQLDGSNTQTPELRIDSSKLKQTYRRLRLPQAQTGGMQNDFAPRMRLSHEDPMSETPLKYGTAIADTEACNESRMPKMLVSNELWTLIELLICGQAAADAAPTDTPRPNARG